MSDTNEDESTKKQRIITADTLREQRRNGGRHLWCTKKEAADVAASMGQMVYDKIREQHAISMQQLDETLEREFRAIKETVAQNILDLQARSFSYRVRRDFSVDCARAAAWWRGKLESWRGEEKLELVDSPPTIEVGAPEEVITT